MLLPPESALRSVISAYALVRADFGAELGERRLVLPNAEFFPDAFRKDAPSTAALVRRLQAHAGMLDIPLRTRVLGSSAEADCRATGGSCGSCGPTWLDSESQSGLVDTGDEWQLTLSRDQLSHPVALVTHLCRVLATIFLVETERDPAHRQLEPPLLVDLLAVGLGFGALLLEGAYVYSKSCGGPSVAKLTHLDVGELAVAVALFAAQDPKVLRKARGALGTTQREALAEAEDWLSGNRELAARLVAAPELLTAGAFALNEPRKAWFSWLGRKRDGTPDALPLRAAPSRSKPLPIDDGLKELVEAALSERG